MKLPSVGPMSNNTTGPSPQKPIRNFFKVPSEGAYRLLEELASNPPKTTQRKLRPSPPSKLSFIFTKDDNGLDDKKVNHEGADQSASDSSMVYFAFNTAEAIPLYILKNPKTASTKEQVCIGFV